MSRHDLATTTVGDLLDDPEVVAIVDRYYPGASASTDARNARGMSAQDALRYARTYLGEAKSQALIAQVEALEPR